ncbi:protein-glutamine gamma-glutamyltransferase [Desertibacillus haloalkaliphilus]|uniref:protein-glutamine gamma-glutamyltransferase n=1 Tax=Desertibacillus haloalkaliphilus TaxID=1328930 RepID=UPI001C277B98|nr:protein-glutamine gamma-glutamyltransferase [Desertibacillus haloalkaliphilus]MBU8906137.1 protein-glutamine gamma-glutamyltransferase [Desertibacillus haloalkaliphilus]
MIQISGIPFQLNDQWELNSVERTIIQHMENAPVLYSYYSVDEFLFEIRLRKNIISNANAMSQSQAQFTTFDYARCNPEYWQLTIEGGFLLRPDVQPADAILDIYENSSLYAYECATAIIIIYYHATLYSIGRNLFNSLFQNLYLYSWHTDSSLTIDTFYSDHFLPGDVVYFNNPDFHPNTPWFRGLNAVLLNDGRFFGHGFPIGTMEQIIEILNDRRRPGSQQQAYLTSLVTRPSIHYLGNFLRQQTSRTPYKVQRPVVHHNKNSICYLQYLYYLANGTD